MSREEVFKTALAYFNDDEMCANIWVDKYCLCDEKGEYLESTPDDMFHRLAKEFARIENKYNNSLKEEEIYELFKDFKYVIPGGSILYGCGNKHSHTSLGNCFVIGDSTDSYGSILKIDEEQAQLMKRRGGVGHDLSHLRPKGSRVNNAAGTSTGAVSFMSRYSNTTREVAQDGRRGALMLTMLVDHPDIIEFIESKSDLTKLTGCNISVKVSDIFMNNVKAGDTCVTEVWSKLIHQAHATAEPGVLFWDTILKNDPCSKYSKDWEPVSTNPCGEIPLCPYDTCRLMSVNLFSFVDKPFTKNTSFNFSKFHDIVYKAQRLMDDVIDLEEEKIDAILDKINKSDEDIDTKARELLLWYKIKRKLIEGRRTGLSFIGLADAIAALGMDYGSEPSIDFVDKVGLTFKNAAYTSSIAMADERGPFQIWNEKIDPIARRNISLLTIPPSGTISMMAGVTSGIEPVYKLEYTRRRKVDKSDNVVFVDKQGDKWEEYNIYHPRIWDYVRAVSTKIMTEKHGEVAMVDITELDDIVKKSPYYGCTAFDIDPIDRIKMQATIQKHIDHSISSTINLPSTATIEDISKIYQAAYEYGCKGITVYRDGCRDGILIDKKSEVIEFKQHDAPKRLKTLEADIRTLKVKGVEHCVIVGLYEGKPYEVFARDNSFVWDILKPEDGRYFISKEKSGQYSLHNNETNYGNITELISDDQAAITRLVSTALRHGTDIKFIVGQLNKTKGDLTSFSKAIARVLKKYIPDGTVIKSAVCEVCGNGMVMENGCTICKSCGNSKCN